MNTLMLMLLLSPFAHGHANLKVNGSIPPRNAATGLKTPPCGGVARTATPKVITAGQTMTVEWQETINHPGRYEFYFSPAGDANFQLLKTVEDVQNNAVVGTNYHQYSTTVTFPNTTCENCTFQLIQVMTENPAAPSLYYSCADIKIQAASTTPPPTTTPTTPVTPEPTTNAGTSCPP